MNLLDAPRKLLLELIAANPDYDMKRLSEALGKNAAYVQQYMHKGSPKDLREPEREKLGAILGVDPDVFRPEGDPKRKNNASAQPRAPAGRELTRVPLEPGEDTRSDLPPNNRSVVIPEYDISPQAGGGAFPSSMAVEDDQRAIDQWSVPRRLVDAFVAQPDMLKIIGVMGDSMEPDFFAGERVMVDTGHTVPTPPGIYVLHDGVGTVIKRVEVVFGSSDPVMLRISSVNPAYGTYERAMSEVHINGRVVGKWVWK